MNISPELHQQNTRKPSQTLLRSSGSLVSLFVLTQGATFEQRESLGEFSPLSSPYLVVFRLNYKNTNPELFLLRRRKFNRQDGPFQVLFLRFHSAVFGFYTSV